MKSVLVTGSDIDESYLSRLRDAGFEVHNPTQDLTEDELIEELRGKHAYLLGGLERATAGALESADELELVAFLGVGYESFVATDVATRRGIAVTNTPGAMVTSVAEMTIGLMLSLTRKITWMNGRLKQGLEASPGKSSDLRGRTAGIVGLGAIGAQVARILTTAFGMNVIYFSRTPKPQLESDLGISYAPLDELLRSADVISLHVPTTAETTPLIGDKELVRMKETAILVNTARAEVVEPGALRKALESRSIAGAAYDGYYIEPLPSPKDDPHGLLSLADDVFIVTPHVASLTHGSWNGMSELAVESIESFFANGTSDRIVNPDYTQHRAK